MTVAELDKQISSNKIKNVYFFFGDEQFLLENKVASIKARLIDPEFEMFNFRKFDGAGLDLAELERAVMDYPQFSEHRMVVLRDTGVFSDMRQEKFKFVRELIRNMPEYTCLVICEKSFDKKKLKNVDFINDFGGVTEFSYLTPKQMEVWLETSFESFGKRILTKDAAYMARLCGSSLGANYSEFQKLIAYVGGRERITREDIEKCVSKSAEYIIYDIFENIVANNRDKVMTQTAETASDTQGALSVITMITSKLADMLTVKELRAEGLGTAQIKGYFSFNVPDFVINKTATQSKRFGERYLRRMIKKGLKYENDIKCGLISAPDAAVMYAGELVAPE